MKLYKFVEFLSNLNVNPPSTNVKPARTNVKPPIDDFLATVLAQLRMQLAARRECMI